MKESTYITNSLLWLSNPSILMTIFFACPMTTMFVIILLETTTTTLTASIAISTMILLAHLVIISLLLMVMNITITKVGLVKSSKIIGVGGMDRIALTGLDARANVLKASVWKDK